MAFHDMKVQWHTMALLTVIVILPMDCYRVDTLERTSLEVIHVNWILTNEQFCSDDEREYTVSLCLEQVTSH